ncbi:MAG: glycosyltransferase family 4 protein [Luteolibacter sp.]
MKIVIATFTYAPNIDGVAEAARMMVENFRNAGHEVRVATGLVESMTDRPTCEESYIRRFAITGSPAVGFGFHGEIEAYREFLYGFNPDVIVFHGWDTWPTEVTLPILPELPCKSVILSHGYSARIIPNLKRFPWGILRYLRWLPYVFDLPHQLRTFDRVVFLSYKTDFGRFYDGWVAEFIDCKNIRVIPNSVTAELKSNSSNFREKMGLGEGILFLCVANYSPRKNQEMALKAFCRANIPGSLLVFIGSSLGDYGRRVQEIWYSQQASHPDLNVYFMEDLTRMEVVSAFRSCDTLVLSATAETQPIVIIEAMACGKPFISTDTGCVSELGGGVVVKTVSEMAKQMRRLAQDPAGRETLGRQARKFFEHHHSPEVINQAWLDLLEDVTGLPGCPDRQPVIERI